MLLVSPRLAPRSISLFAILVGCSAAPSAASKTSLSPNAAHNLLGNATFDGGKSLPWTTSFTSPATGKAKVENGEFCIEVTDKGSANWDAQFRHREMTIRKGHRYFVRFRARSSQPTSIRPKVGMAGPPYREYFWQEIDLGAAPRLFEYEFTMQQDDDPPPSSRFTSAAISRATSGRRTRSASTTSSSTIRSSSRRGRARPSHRVGARQPGRLLSVARQARHDQARRAARPVGATRRQRRGRADGHDDCVRKGRRLGRETSHRRLLRLRKAGKGLHAEGRRRQEPSFRHRRRPVRSAQVPRARLFLSQSQRHRDHVAVRGRKAWARPAGHVADQQRARTSRRREAATRSTSRAAGTTRATTANTSSTAASRCGRCSINTNAQRTSAVRSATSATGRCTSPRIDNGVPDLLDEARWELEFLLKMQVPEGQPLAGMAHHKMHDKDWTALGTRPDEDKMPRTLRAPSTAATLNLAATRRRPRASARARRPVCAQLPGGRRKGVDGGQGAPRSVRPRVRFEGRRALRRQGRRRRVLLGRGRALRDDRRSRLPRFRRAVSLLQGGAGGPRRGARRRRAFGDELAKHPGARVDLARDGAESDLRPPRSRRFARTLSAAADAFLRAMHGQGHRVPFQPGPKGNTRGVRTRSFSTTRSCSRLLTTSRKTPST